MKHNALEQATGAPPGHVASLAMRRIMLQQPAATRGLKRLAAGSLHSLLLNPLASTLFPCNCRLCACPLVRASRLPVCGTCLNSIPAQPGPLCGTCGEALDLDMESVRFGVQTGLVPVREAPLCAPCRRVPPAFLRAVAFGAYESELRELIHLLKYERLPEAARPLGALLAQAILRLRPQVGGELTVIAVPLFAARQRRRGYNQTILLAEAALATLRRLTPEWKLRPAHHLLTRTRDTESQFALTPRDRRRNLRGAFAVQHTAPIVGREILLIDDIYTTGATARECSRVLLSAGARRVWVATLSRAQPEVAARWTEPHPAEWAPAHTARAAHPTPATFN